MKLWVWFLALHKQGVTVHSCNCRTCGMEAGRLGHPWLHPKFMISYMKINLVAYDENKFQILRQPFPTCPFKETSGVSPVCLIPPVKSQHGFQYCFSPFLFLRSNSGNLRHVNILILLSYCVVGGNRVLLDSSGLNESFSSPGFFELLLQLFPLSKLSLKGKSFIMQLFWKT